MTQEKIKEEALLAVYEVLKMLMAEVEDKIFRPRKYPENVVELILNKNEVPF